MVKVGGKRHEIGARDMKCGTWRTTVTKKKVMRTSAAIARRMPNVVRSLGMAEVADGTADPDLIRKICEEQGNVTPEQAELMIAHGGVHWV